MSEDYNEIAQAMLQNGAFMAAMKQSFETVLDKTAQSVIQVAQKATLPNNPSYNAIHGWGSMFGTPQVGIDPEVISAMMHWRGLGEHLPREGVKTLEVFLPFITWTRPAQRSPRPSVVTASAVNQRRAFSTSRPERSVGKPKR
jgi:hypothetical protein